METTITQIISWLTLADSDPSEESLASLRGELRVVQ